jgi:hypothetical protein
MTMIPRHLLLCICGALALGACDRAAASDRTNTNTLPSSAAPTAEPGGTTGAGEPCKPNAGKPCASSAQGATNPNANAGGAGQVNTGDHSEDTDNGTGGMGSGGAPPP